MPLFRFFSTRSSSGPVQPWLVLAVVLAADVLDLLDATLTTIAAPTITRELGASDALIPWLGASYALALGSLLVLGARMGDRFGQRRTFLIGALGFTLASVACGLAWSPVPLVVARLVQGAFGALLIPQGFALIQQSFPRDRLGAAFSLFGPVLGLSAVGGPILAGLLIGANFGGLTWRPMFLINIVIGAAMIIMAIRVLPTDRCVDDQPPTIDAWGAALLSGAMLALLGGLIMIAGSSDALVASLILAAGLALAALFVRRQHHAANPLITPSLFHNRGFVAGLLLGVVFFAAVSGLLYVVSLYLQAGLNKTPEETALLTAPTAAGMVIASVACFRLIHRLGRNLVALGLTITLLGVAGLLTLVLAAPMDPPLIALRGCLLVIGLGMGTCFGTIFDITIGDIEPHEAGSASGSLNAVQQLSNATGAAVMSSIFLSLAATATAQTATVTSLVIVGLVAIVCLAMVRLLPRRAQAGH